MTKFTKVLLRTVELNRNNEEEDEITVLNRETLEDIISNLDLDELAYQAHDMARGYHFSGNVHVSIDAKDGEVSVAWIQSNRMKVGYYNTRINLFCVPTGGGYEMFPEFELYWFTEDEHINYFKELEERNRRIEEEDEEGEIMDDYEIRDAVIEKFNLDFDKLQEEYFRIADAQALYCLYDEYKVLEQIDELYSNIVPE